uniref:UPAR/Ly6 domain-containing protein n=1 Tax=Ascaris lumbricoides TaxID=6252 RepID=A0A9J2P9R7_ASCLU
MPSLFAFPVLFVAVYATFETVQLKCYAGEGDEGGEMECGMEPACCYRLVEEFGTSWGCMKTIDENCFERNLQKVPKASLDISCCRAHMCNAPFKEDGTNVTITEMRNAEERFYSRRQLIASVAVAVIFLNTILILSCSLCFLKGHLYCTPPL